RVEEAACGVRFSQASASASGSVHDRYRKRRAAHLHPQRRQFREQGRRSTARVPLDSRSVRRQDYRSGKRKFHRPPQRARRMVDRSEESSGCPRLRQPHVALSLRTRHRGHSGRLRAHGRSSHASRITGLPHGILHRRRLEHEKTPPYDSTIEYLSAVGGWRTEKDIAQTNRRSVYIFVRRNLRYPMLQEFDSANTFESCDLRKPTVTPSQSLDLLNNDLVVEWAQSFAGRVLNDSGLT